MQIVNLTREELYRLVWSEPMTKVAARYELSDQGLKKICLKHRIPVPGRGYWQKLQSGGKAAPIALPKMTKEEPIVIRIRLKQPAQEAQMDDEATRAEQPFGPVHVLETLERPHAITRSMRDELKRAKGVKFRNKVGDEYGAIHCIEPDGFLLRIHPNSEGRALRIIDAFVKACVVRGFGFKPGKRGARIGGQMRILVDDEEIEVAFEEKMRRESHKPTADEIARRKRSQFVYAPTYDYVPTDMLSIKIGPSYSSGLQSTWADTRHQRIDDRLNDVFVGIRRLSRWRKEERRKDAERQVRFEEVQRARAELRSRFEAEKKAVAQLEMDADSWRRAEAIRAYVAAVGARADGTDAEQAAWIEWALAQADRLDPLRDNPPSILDTPESDMATLALWQYRDLTGT
jgi:hypothetical protein